MMCPFQVVADVGNGVLVTVEADRLAAKLGLQADELHAKLRHCYGVYARGTGQVDGCFTFRYGPRSWVVVVGPGGAIGGDAMASPPQGEPQGWLTSLSWRSGE